MRTNSKGKRRKGVGANLVNWLNGEAENYHGKPTKASRARIEALVAAIKKGSEMLVAADEEDPEADLFDFMPRHLSTMTQEIQELLNDYPKWPLVEVSYCDRRAVLSISDGSGPGRALGEQVAAWDIATLTNERRLDSVRQCLCGRWFIALRADQASCSPTCRHKTYEQTDAFKVKRRQYMRNYYRLKQSGKVK